MRAFRWASLASLALLLLAPAPAHAWWDYIEQFSGPGPMWGFDIEGRLVCFARKPTPAVRIANLQFDRAAVLQRSYNGDFNKERAARLATAWQAVVSAWNGATNVPPLPGTPPDAAPRGQQAAAGGENELVEQARRSIPRLVTEAETFANNNAGIPEAKEWLDQVTRAVRARERAESSENIDDNYPARILAGGFIYSACDIKNYARRRASIDLGMRFLWSKDDPQFANGSRIMFTTVEPAFTWHLISNEKWDFVDYGVGVGYYWFSSEAFPSFGSYFLEPIRLDFHFPPGAIRNHGKANPLNVLQFIVVRYGQLVFPGGFETAKFAARADVPARIDRDWITTIGVFVDLEAIVKYRRGKGL